MVERHDPASTGVVAGRVVGLLTAALAVWSLLSVQGSAYRNVGPALELVGLGYGLPADALFWAGVAVTAIGRYTVAYVVGSLVGVLYDWADRSAPVLVGAVVAVAVVDGTLAAIDTRSALIGAAYVLAWLCYLPAFRYVDPGEPERRSGARRLGNT